MKSIMVGVVNYFLQFILRVSPIKFVVMTVMFVLIEILMQVVWDMLPDWMNLNGIFNFLTPGMWFFLDLVNISLGAPLVISAYATKFLIRRIPVVG